MSAPLVTFTPLPGCFIKVYPTGTISQGIKSHAPEAAIYNAAIGGLESLLLALAQAGIDLSTSEYHQAVEMALEAIDDHH